MTTRSPLVGLLQGVMEYETLMETERDGRPDGWNEQKPHTVSHLGLRSVDC
jgi:hypothetical protein